MPGLVPHYAKDGPKPAQALGSNRQNIKPLTPSPLSLYHPTPLYREGYLVAGSRMGLLLGVTILQKWVQPQPVTSIGGRPGGAGVRWGDDPGVQTPAQSNLLPA